jgi:hypothetical protein
MSSFMNNVKYSSGAETLVQSADLSQHCRSIQTAHADFHREMLAMMRMGADIPFSIDK